MAIWDTPDKLEVGEVYLKTRKKPKKYKDTYDHYLAVPLYRKYLNKKGQPWRSIYGSVELYNPKTKQLTKNFWRILQILSLVLVLPFLEGCVSKTIYSVVDTREQQKIINSLTGEECHEGHMIIDPEKITYYYPYCDIRVEIHPKESILPPNPYEKKGRRP